MRSAEQIQVTYEAMETAASDAESAANKIQGQLEQLKAYLAPLVASWTGEASTDYQARQKLWDTSADALLNGVLRQIASTLRTSVTNYAAAERQVRQTTSGR